MEKYQVEVWDHIDYHWYFLSRFTSKSEALSYLEKMKQDEIFKNKEMRVVQIIEEYKPQ